MKRRTFLKSSATLCAAATASASFPTIARSARPKLKVLITGAPPDPSVHYLYYAQFNGFYETIDVSFALFNAGTTVTRALVAGEGDVAWAPTVSTMQAIAAGARLKCIDGITPKTDWVVIANKQVNSLRDLEGKTFAVAAIRAPSEVGPQLLLERSKVDTKKVRWLGVGGSSARVQALLAKEVDATALTPTFAAVALRHGDFHQIGDLAKDLPRFSYCLDMASLAAIESKSDALSAFVIGAARGAKWALENPKEAARASAKILPDVSEELLLATTEAHSKSAFYNPSAIYSREDFDFMYESSLSLGMVRAGFKYEDFYYPKLALAAGAAVR